MKIHKLFAATAFATIVSTAPMKAHAAPQDSVPAESIVAARTGMSFVPSGNATVDQQVAYAISCMLADELTKDEAVQIALLNNRSLQARFAELGIALGDFVEAGLLENPVFEYVRTKSKEPMTVASIEYSIVQDFMSLLLLPLRRKVAAAEYERTKLEIVAEILDVAFETQKSYYRVQESVQIGGIYQAALEATECSYESAKEIHEAGNISDLELHHEQAIYEEQKLMLAEAEAEAIELRERLNVLMGLWGPCTEYKIADRLPKIPGKEIALQGLESVAVCRRVDLEAARLAIDAAARRSGLKQITGLIPELEFGYTAERETDGTWLRGWQASFPIPIFNQGQGQVTGAMARLCAAQNRYYALAVEIRSEVRTAYAKMSKARERVRYYEKVMLPLRTRMVEESQLMFNAMDISVFDLLQAKREQLTAGREMIEATRDYWEGRSDLEKALGGSLACSGMTGPAQIQPALDVARHSSPPAGPMRRRATGAVFHVGHGGIAPARASQGATAGHAQEGGAGGGGGHGESGGEGGGR